MRPLLTAAFVVFGIASALDVASAQQPGASTGWQRSPSTASEWKAARPNPYSRLFEPTKQSDTHRPAGSADSQAPKPVIKCGMVLIPGDPAIDPGIASPAGKTTTRFTIRGVEPPICK